MKKLVYMFLAIVLFSCQQKEKESNRLQYIMDMVHDNPGEERTVTKYKDPLFLKSKGYNASVAHWHVQCAITYDNFEENIVPQGSEARKWIENKAVWIDERLDAMEEAGIDVYPFTDFVVFPKQIFEKYGNEIARSGEVEMGDMKEDQAQNSNMQSEMLQKLVVAQVDAIFNRFPAIDGLTLRFGETYLHDAPFHMGGSPIRKDRKLGVKDHITLMNLLREEICVKRNKKLFYRTWDFGHRFHTNPEYYLAVTDNVEPHENLIMSIKHQSDDFHRMVHFNETLGIGKHKQIVEVCCQLDSYGKAAHPYYIGSGVINGWPETAYEINRDGWYFTGKPANPDLMRGIKELVPTGKLVGVFTWSRGGGWFGPYIKHEINTDINTLVVSRWAQDTSKSEEEIFFEVAAELGITGESAKIFRKINLKTIEAVRKGHCNSFVSNNIWWTRDHFFHVSYNNRTIKQVIEQGLVSDFLSEKAESVEGWKEIERLARNFEVSDKELQEAFIVSCSYGRIKYELIEQMWTMMLYNAKGESENKFYNEEISNAIKRYDELWEEWKDLKANNPHCATIYTDLAMWHKREGSVGELVDQLREKN